MRPWPVGALSDPMHEMNNALPSAVCGPDPGPDKAAPEALVQISVLTPGHIGKVTPPWTVVME